MQLIIPNRDLAYEKRIINMSFNKNVKTVDGEKGEKIEISPANKRCDTFLICPRKVFLLMTRIE